MQATEDQWGARDGEVEPPSLGYGGSPPPPHYIAYLAVSPYRRNLQWC